MTGKRTRIGWNSNGPRRVRFTCVLLVLVVLVSLVHAEDPRPESPGDAPLRFAFASSSLFPEVTETDAKAALKVWARALGQDRGVPVDMEAYILSGTEVIARAMRTRIVDAVSLLSHDYWVLGRELLSGPFILGVNEGRVTEEYVLLVHQGSGIKGVGDLRGRSLICLQNPRTSLAPFWLDVLLTRSGFSRSVEFCGGVARVTKVSQAVLPVFFRKSDACLVTRRGFQTMSELNPQVGVQLKVLASSPEVVPCLFCFRKDYAEPTKDRLLAEVGKIHTTPAGQQILTIFQCQSLEVHSLSILESTIALLDEHHRLQEARGSTKGGKN